MKAHDVCLMCMDTFKTLKPHKSNIGNRKGGLSTEIFLLRFMYSIIFSVEILRSLLWTILLTVFLLVLCLDLVTSSLCVCWFFTRLQPFRQQQLLKQIDVLSTPLLSSVPRRHSQHTVDVIVQRDFLPGCVVGWRAYVTGYLASGLHKSSLWRLVPGPVVVAGPTKESGPPSFACWLFWYGLVRIWGSRSLQQERRSKRAHGRQR